MDKEPDADDNDINECSQDDKPAAGMFVTMIELNLIIIIKCCRNLFIVVSNSAPLTPVCVIESQCLVRAPTL